MVRGDTTVISKATGVPAFKGPRYAADLPTVLDSLCEVQLSTTVPADDLLREKLAAKSLAGNRENRRKTAKNCSRNPAAC